MNKAYRRMPRFPDLCKENLLLSQQCVESLIFFSEITSVLFFSLYISHQEMAVEKHLKSRNILEIIPKAGTGEI